MREIYTVEFALKAPAGTIAERIRQLPDFIAREDLEDTPHAWIWEFKEATPQKKPATKQETQKSPVHRMDSRIRFAPGKWIRYQAELKIQNETLIIDVNSQKRAFDAETFFQKHLGSLLGTPTLIKLEQPSISKSNAQDDTFDISPEEQERMIRDMLEQHYTDWLDSPLPVLKNKTPRQAVKTKSGRIDVTNLLKDMQNAELHDVQNGRKAKPYNFDWMFAELGIA